MAARDELAVFSYGTLLNPDLQRSVFGRIVTGDDDVLVGYKLSYIEVPDRQIAEWSGQQQHPIIRPTGNPLDKVFGKVIHLTEQELDSRDDFALWMFSRTPVTLASGRTAWAYVASSIDESRDAAD
ncbi:gamma-glutamylcyclotransferase family protein [Microbacterium sp. BWT-B31]|uniref:gamma-glutamylcyclotransferase family protein n=1 Tax=Microbacterium sp. BWT-B31 TaxID=3232072 RepID=UPI0035292560